MSNCDLDITGYKVVVIHKITLNIRGCLNVLVKKEAKQCLFFKEIHSRKQKVIQLDMTHLLRVNWLA